MRLALDMSLVRISGMAGEEPPDANTLFLTRFKDATPTDEAGGGAGTLVGNASCDTAAKELVLDGTGDWCTFAGGARFDPTADWTLEFHTNLAAAQVGGVISRSAAGASRYVVYAAGDGTLTIYDAAIGGAALDGSWHHFAFVISGGGTRFYRDGVQVSSGAGGPPSSSGDTFYIGTDAFDTTGRDVAGRIARVKISNVARYPGGTPFTPPARTAV